jgi:hypothetical protein
MKAVLAIGIDPRFADLSTMPHLTTELIQSYIDAQIEALRKSGYDPLSCLVDLGDTAEEVVTRALKAKRFDCVVIGAGLRKPDGLFLLFEKVINLVHRHAPEAVQRWI